MKIALKDLKPNPFKKEINGGKLNPSKIALLKESIEKDGFWDNVICRKVNSHYELAYGHHRVEAARQVLGDDYEVNIPVKELNDEMMLRILGNENCMQNEEYAVYQVDQVVVTKKYLETVLTADSSKKTHKNEIGCREIAEFLGEKNWGKTKVADLLNMANKLHPSIMKELRNTADVGAPKESTELSLSHGRRIARLDDKNDQMKAAKLVKKYGLSTRETEIVVDKIKNDNAKNLDLETIQKDKRSDKPMLENYVREICKKLFDVTSKVDSVTPYRKNIKRGSRILLDAALDQMRTKIEAYFKQEVEE